MPQYRVRDGHRLSHDDQVLSGGAVVELPAHVGSDTAVRGVLEELDESGQVKLPPASAVDEALSGVSPADRVAALEAAVAEARARLSDLQKLLTAARRELAASPADTPAPAAAPDAQE